VDDKRSALLARVEQVAAISLTAVTIYITVQQSRNTTEVANSRARAYRGAADFYRGLAEYFGKKALRAETAYYQEIRP
jgi:hypothetical protein